MTLCSQVQQSIKLSRELLQTQGKETSTIVNASERRRAMDLVPRKSKYTADILAKCAKIGSALQKLVDEDEEVFQVTTALSVFH